MREKGEELGEVGDTDSADLGWGSRFCISDKLLGAARAESAAPGILMQPSLWLEGP